MRAALCPRDPNPLRAELYALNLYLYGGHFTRHKDTPRGSDMVGSLVVELGPPYKGGELVACHRGVTEVFRWGGKRYKEPGERAGWAAFFGDVDHEVGRVLSGERVTLTYTLRRGGGSGARTSPPRRCDRG